MDSSNPAASTACLAMFIDWSPTWLTQPRSTSSICRDSRPLRSRITFKTPAARSTGCTSLSAPPGLPRPTGVRTTSTRTASLRLLMHPIVPCAQQPRRVTQRAETCRISNRHLPLPLDSPHTSPALAGFLGRNLGRSSSHSTCAQEINAHAHRPPPRGIRHSAHCSRRQRVLRQCPKHGSRRYPEPRCGFRLPADDRQLRHQRHLRRSARGCPRDQVDLDRDDARARAPLRVPPTR